MDQLEERIARLEAVREIEALSMQYCVACDTCDLEALLGLFCDDAEMVIPAFAAVVKGADAIREVFRAEFAALGRTFHWTHDRMIGFDSGGVPETAHGTVIAHAEVALDGRTNIAAMRYEDRYRRVGERWRFAVRRIGFVYYLPIENYGAQFDQTDRIFRGGIWLPGEDALRTSG